MGDLADIGRRTNWLPSELKSRVADGGSERRSPVASLSFRESAM